MTVTVCGTFQLDEVKTIDVGLTSPSVESLELIGRVTFAVGSESNSMVKLTALPVSLVVAPEGLLTETEPGGVVM